MSKTIPLWKPALAELIGTFIFIAVILYVTTPNSQTVLIPLVIGLTLAIAIWFTLPISKGSMNPAVSIALGLRGDLTPVGCVVYIIAEIIGALLAFAWWKYLVNSSV
jgi:aquaporin Z